MPGEPELITVTALEAMTPNERSAAFERGLITDLDELPEAFRTRIIATAERLGRERRCATD